MGASVARTKDFDPQAGDPSKHHGHRFSNPATKAAFEAWQSNLRGDAGGALTSLQAQEPDPAATDASNRDKKARPNPEHLAILKQGRDVWNKWRDDNPSIRPDLQGLANDDLIGSPIWGEYKGWAGEKKIGALLVEFNFFGADFKYANLSGATLKRANLSDTNLSYSNLSSAYMEHANLIIANLMFANLKDAVVYNARIRSANLSRANLCGANFSSSDLSFAYFSLADLSRAYLRSANLQGATMVQTVLREADLSESYLNGVYLVEANLAGANLSEAKLDPLPLPKSYDAPHEVQQPYPPPQPTDMSFCDLRNANLSGANFSDANLAESNLTNTNMTNAVFRGTNVTRVGYDRKFLTGKCYGVNADGMYGDATFRRDVMDQDYIDTLYTRMAAEGPTGQLIPWSQMPPIQTYWMNATFVVRWFLNDLANATTKSSTWFAVVIATIGSWILFYSSINSGTLVPAMVMVPAAFGGFAVGLFFNTWFGRRFLLALWSLLGYGRDWDRVAIFASVMIGILGFVYSAYGCYQGTCDASHAFQFFDGKQPLDQHPIYPWYIAALGFATLGISDLIRPLTGFGMLIVSLNVLAGFSTLGLLLAVLSDRFARRA